MRKEKQNVEVKDPTVKEMGKKNSCVRKACSRGCFFILIFFIGFLALLKFTSTSGTKEVKDIPKNFPDSVPVYSEKYIKKITVTSDKLDSVPAKVAKIVPKFLLVSSYVALGDNSPQELKNYLNIKKTNQGTVKTFTKLMQQPTEGETQKIVIEWTNLKAEPNFIQEYYEKGLEKNDYKVTITTDKKDKKQISFNKNNTTGRIYIEDQVEDPGTTLVSLTILIPTE